MLRHEPGQVGGGAEGAAVDLGQAERCVGRRDHDVGVADDADAAAEAEAVDRGDHRHLALVHRRERGVAPAVHADEGLVARVLQLLDVDPGAEATALGGDDHHAHVGVGAQPAHDARQLEPPVDRQGIDGREVDDDLGDAGGVDLVGHGHGERQR